VVVELTIDEQGQISAIRSELPLHLQSPGLRRSIESSLLFTKFTPATTFGQPIVGSFACLSDSSINVKG